MMTVRDRQDGWGDEAARLTRLLNESFDGLVAAAERLPGGLALVEDVFRIAARVTAERTLAGAPEAVGLEQDFDTIRRCVERDEAGDAARLEKTEDGRVRAVVDAEGCLYEPQCRRIEESGSRPVCPRRLYGEQVIARLTGRSMGSVLLRTLTPEGCAFEVFAVPAPVSRPAESARRALPAMHHSSTLANATLSRLDAEREAILDSVDAAIMVVSPVKEVTYLNRRACAVFGVHADEAVGRRLERGGVLGRLGDLCIAEALRLGKWEGTAKIEDADGGRIRSVYLARFSSITSRDGGLAGTVIVLDDVTTDEFLRRRLAQEKSALAKTVEEKTRELKSANARLEVLARTDALTALPNRRMIEEVLSAELARAARYNHSTGLLMIDVDDFKSINDKMGHQIGDEVLRHVASILRRSIRASDTVARWGGDEFAVVLPRAGAAECESVTRRIGENLLIENAAGDRVPGVALGLSVGWAAQAGGDSTALLARADMMMYDCKTAKKARVARNVTGSD